MDGVCVLPNRRRPLAACVALTVLIASACGRSPARDYHAGRAKNDAADVAVAAQGQPTPSAPEAWLDRMVEAYREAASYADQGELVLTYTQGGEETRDRVSFAVQFQRPSKLAAALYQATLASDGQTFRALLDDLEGQVLTLPVPTELTLDWLYQDGVLSRVLTEGLARSSPQLDLLLGGQSLAAIRRAAQRIALVGDQQLDDRLCTGVKLTQAEGDLVLWIDRQSHELRRIDYPTANLPPGARLTAYLKKARLGTSLEEQVFVLEPPPEAKAVVRFVPPPLPLPSLLGQAPEGFSLEGLDGTTITKDSLAGKTTVLEFWFKDCPPCPERMPRLNGVYRKFRDDDRVQFLTVSVDGPEVAGDQLLATLAGWKVDLPAARDPEGRAAQAFHCQGFPQTIVLGPDGRVQALDTPLAGEVLPELPAMLERLLAGQDVAGELRERFATHEQAYRQALADAVAGTAPEVPAAPAPVIAPASPPANPELKRAWSAAGLRLPGNIVVVEDEGRPARLLAIEGARAVAELDSQGQVVARHALPVPEGSLVTYLRTALDGQGQRFFAGSASGQAQAHVFDDQWRLVLSFPPTESPHPGLGDVQLADLDADGQLELVVGYWGEVGVQTAGFDGRRKWFNRSLENVPRIVLAPTAAPGPREIWCLNGRGTIVPIDTLGKQGQDLEVPGRFLMSLVAAAAPAGAEARYCGLSVSGREAFTAVGFDGAGHELWHYALPAGAHRKPIEAIAYGPALPGRPDCWLLAGPDGTVHVVSPEGDAIDRFALGRELTGLAAAKVDGAPTILVSTPDAVEAWQVAATATADE